MIIRREEQLEVGKYYIIRGEVAGMPLPLQIFQVSQKGATAGRPWIRGTVWLRLGKNHGQRMWPGQHMFLDQAGIGIPRWEEHDIWMESLPEKLEHLTGRGYHEVIRTNQIRHEEAVKGGGARDT